MTDEATPELFLLWEWTEEREAKMHLGIYATRERAEAASQLYWEHEQKDRGAEPHEVGPVVWKTTVNGADTTFLWGTKTMNITEGDPESEDLAYSNDADCPYEIEVFNIDTVYLHDYVDGETTTKRIVVS